MFDFWGRFEVAERLILFLRAVGYLITPTTLALPEKSSTTEIGSPELKFGIRCVPQFVNIEKRDDRRNNTESSGRHTRSVT
jgi:hypothetical protein